MDTATMERAIVNQAGSGPIAQHALVQMIVRLMGSVLA